MDYFQHLLFIIIYYDISTRIDVYIVYTLYIVNLAHSAITRCCREDRAHGYFSISGAYSQMWWYTCIFKSLVGHFKLFFN